MHDADDDLDAPEVLPDLAELPRDRWPAVFADLDDWSRRRCIERLWTRCGEEAMLAALEVQFDVDQRKPRTPATPRGPQGVPPRRGAGRQIGFRLGPEEYEGLVSAAGLFGVRPATLARMLCVRGVAAALLEDKRWRERR